MFEAYSIGIRLSLMGNVMGEFSALSRAIKASGGDVDKLQGKLDKIKSQAATGLGMIGAGIAIAGAFKPAVNEAIRLEQAMNRIKSLNLGVGATGQLADMAKSLSRNGQYGMSQSQALALVAETQGVTANTQHTLEILPGLAKMKFGIDTYMSSHGLGEGQGEAADQQFQAVVKAMEMRGLMRNFSPDQAGKLEDLFTKAFVASGGQVKPTDFLAMMKTGGVAAKQLSPDFMLALGHIMQEMGGSRTGTSIMSAYQNLVGGRSTQQVAEQLVKLGLVNKADLKYSTTGKLLKLAPGALKDSELFQSNPLEYMNQKILPAIAKNLHIDMKDIDSDKNRNKVLNQLNTMFSNRTASSLFTQMYTDRQNLGQYLAQTKGVAGVDQLNAQAQDSTVGNIGKAEADFHTMLGQLGTAVLPPLNAILHQVVPMVQKLDDVMTDNPRLTKYVVDGLLGLSAALVVAGGINTLSAGVKMLGLALSLSKAAVLVDLAKGIGVFTKAMLMSEIGGAGGFMASAAKFGSGVASVGVAMQALGVIGAAAVGWEAGGWISRHFVEGTKAGDWIGNAEAHVMASLGSKEAEDALYGNNKGTGSQQVIGTLGKYGLNASPVKPGGNAPMVQVSTNVQADGHTLAKVVTTHQSNEWSGPQTGVSGFDSSAGAPNIGWNGGGQ